MLDTTTLPTRHSEENRGKSVAKQAAEMREEAHKGACDIQRHVMRISYIKAAGKEEASTAQVAVQGWGNRAAAKGSGFPTPGAADEGPGA